MAAKRLEDEADDAPLRPVGTDERVDLSAGPDPDERHEPEPRATAVVRGEAREERDAVPGSHQRLGHVEVVDAVPHPRTRAGARGHGLEYRRHREARADRDPLLVGEVLWRHRDPLREAVLRRQRDVERLAEQRDDQDAPVGGTGPLLAPVGPVRDHDVELARQVHERVLCDVLVAALHDDLRVVGEPAEQTRQEHLRRALERGDPHDARGLVEERSDGRRRAFERDRDTDRLPREGVTRRGQPESPPDPFGERDADVALQRLELLRDR